MMTIMLVFSFPQQYMFLFQVYLPCSNHLITVYLEYMEKLYDIYNMYSPLGTVICLGDFNANIDISNHHSRDNILYNFLSDVNYVAANTLPCGRGATCSYVSYDNSSKTLIDCICLPVEMSDLISHTEIVDAHCLNGSRHRPVVCRLLIPDNHIDTRDTINVDTSNPINWRRALDYHIT